MPPSLQDYLNQVEQAAAPPAPGSIKSIDAFLGEIGSYKKPEYGKQRKKISEAKIRVIPESVRLTGESKDPGLMWTDPFMATGEQEFHLVSKDYKPETAPELQEYEDEINKSVNLKAFDRKLDSQLTGILKAAGVKDKLIRQKVFDEITKLPIYYLAGGMSSATAAHILGKAGIKAAELIVPIKTAAAWSGISGTMGVGKGKKPKEVLNDMAVSGGLGLMAGYMFGVALPKGLSRIFYKDFLKTLTHPEKITLYRKVVARVKVMDPEAAIKPPEDYWSKEVMAKLKVPTSIARKLETAVNKTFGTGFKFNPRLKSLHIVRPIGSQQYAATEAPIDQMVTMFGDMPGAEFRPPTWNIPKAKTAADMANITEMGIGKTQAQSQLKSIGRKIVRANKDMTAFADKLNKVIRKSGTGSMKYQNLKAGKELREMELNDLMEEKAQLDQAAMQYTEAEKAASIMKNEEVVIYPEFKEAEFVPPEDIVPEAEFPEIPPEEPVSKVMETIDRVPERPVKVYAKYIKQLKASRLKAVTNLPGKEAGERLLEKSLKHSERTGVATNLMFIDVDNMKFLNKKYGHIGVDKILRLIADTMKANLKGRAGIYNPYGDEYMLIMQGDPKKMEGKMESIKAITQKKLKDLGYSDVTVSHGVATKYEDGINKEKIIEEAEQMLEAEKEMKAQLDPEYIKRKEGEPVPAKEKVPAAKKKEFELPGEVKGRIVEGKPVYKKYQGKWKLSDKMDLPGQQITVELPEPVQNIKKITYHGPSQKAIIEFANGLETIKDTPPEVFEVAYAALRGTAEQEGKIVNISAKDMLPKDIQFKRQILTDKNLEIDLPGQKTDTGRTRKKITRSMTGELLSAYIDVQKDMTPAQKKTLMQFLSGTMEVFTEKGLRNRIRWAYRHDDRFSLEKWNRAMAYLKGNEVKEFIVEKAPALSIKEIQSKAFKQAIEERDLPAAQKELLKQAGISKPEEIQKKYSSDITEITQDLIDNKINHVEAVESVYDLVREKEGPEYIVKEKQGFYDLSQEDATKKKYLKKSTESKLKLKIKRKGGIILTQESILSPADIAESFRFLKDETVERSYFIALDGADKVLYIEPISIGMMNAAIVDTFEPLFIAFDKKIKSFYVLHNHPSGEIEASAEDITISDKFQKGYKAVGIDYKGHIIIDTTKFGFIDPKGEASVHEFAGEIKAGKKIPLYAKYKEWLADPEATKPIDSPDAVGRLIKALNADNGSPGIVYMDARLKMNHFEFISKKQLSTRHIAQTAAGTRSKTVILINPNKDINEINMIRRELIDLGISIQDAVTVYGPGLHESAMEEGLLREPAEEYGKDIRIRQLLKKRKRLDKAIKTAEADGLPDQLQDAITKLHKTEDKIDIIVMKRNKARGIPYRPATQIEIYSPTLKKTWTRNKTAGETRRVGPQGRRAELFTPEQRIKARALPPGRDLPLLEGRAYSMRQDGTLIKDKEIEYRTKQIEEAREKVPTFISKLRTVLNQKIQGPQPAEVILNIARKNVKQEEIEWSGLEEFLKEHTKPTKEQLMTHIESAQVGLDEIWKGIIHEPKIEIKYEPKLSKELPYGLYLDGMEYNRSESRAGLREESKWLKEEATETATKYEKYILPGAKNYRELLLVYPTKKILQGGKISYYLNKVEEIRYFKTYDEAKKFKETQIPEGAKSIVLQPTGVPSVEPTYKSPHWDEPNVLVNVRLDDRMTVPDRTPSKKVLFIEEIQSDWHQEGRRKGYITSKPLSNAEYKEYDRLMALEGTGQTQETEDRLEELIARKEDTAGIPDAPFKKTWHELALKRILREAAEKGYDYVSWTTGAQQADRYDLSKQVREIRSTKLDNGNYDILVTDKTGRDINLGELSESKLTDNIGKELSSKIIKDSEIKKSNIYSGLDLKVGGEGMKGFYDRMIPRYLNKYTKKWASSVEEIKIEVGGGIEETVQAVKITPPMVKSILYAGQEMFAGPGVPTKDIKKFMEFIFDDDIDVASSKVVLRQSMAEKSRAIDATYTKYGKYEILIEKMKGMVKKDLIHKFEYGEYGELQPDTAKMLKSFRALLDRAYEVDMETLNYGYIENYFPALFKEKEKAREFTKNFYSKLRSTPGFAKKKYYKYIEEAEAAGLTLISDNIATIILKRVEATLRNKMRNDVMIRLKEMGFMVFNKAGKEIPHGWSKTKDESLRMIVKKGKKGEEEFIYTGDYIFPNPVTRLLNKWLSPSLWANETWIGKGYRAMMAIKNAQASVMLTLSSFHAIETAISSKAVLDEIGVRQITRGQYLKGIKTLMEAPFFPLISLVRGWEGRSAWRKGAKSKYQKWALEIYLRGGGRPMAGEQFRNNGIKQIQKALAKGDYLGVGVNIIPMFAEIASYLVMDFWIPRLKEMAYLRTAADYLENSPTASRMEQDIELSKIWNDTDDRFGQLVYDNIFWPKVIKELFMGFQFSFGWGFGSGRQIVGAHFDLAKSVRDVFEGEEVYVTRRSLYHILYLINIGLIGGLTTWALTGERPKEILDFFNPRSGYFNDDGSPERYTIPSAAKEYTSFREAIRKKGWLLGPLKVVGNKMAPLLAQFIDVVIENQDYYGTEIRNTNSPLYKQTQQVMQYLVMASMPLSFQGIRRMAGKHKDAPWFIKMLPWLMPPSPKYLSKTKIQHEISDLYEKRFGGDVSSRAQWEKSDQRRKIKKRILRGERIKGEEVRELLKQQIINQKTLRKYYKMQRQGILGRGDIIMFKRFTAEDQRTLLNKMKDKDLWEYFKYVNKDLRTEYIKKNPKYRKYLMRRKEK